MQTYSNSVYGESVETPEHQEIFNPATGDSLGLAPISSESDVGSAVNAARKAQPDWARTSDQERRDAVVRVAQVLEENSEYLAELITREQGKPLSGPGSRFEMQASVGWTQVPAALELPPEIVYEDEERKDTLHRVPLGVVAAIAPWNWPLMIAIWQIIPSIRMGNTVVLKPSEYTPIATLEMVRLINQVLPPGVLNTVSGDGRIGAALTSHPDIDKIMFTGSEATGRRIIEASTRNLAPITLELGGNDAAIVLPGTDASAIAEGLFWGAFLNMGQTCACIKRLYVHESDYEAVVNALSNLAQQMPIGDGMDENNLIGPLQNKMQYDKVKDLVADARANGCEIMEFGTVPDTGYFLPLTLVGNIRDGQRLVDEEQFGPALPIIRYQSLDEAVASANRLDAGLGASVWADDPEQAQQVAVRLEAGTVWINQHGAIHPMVPFGGNKASGYGVEFGLEGLKAVTQPRVISIKK
ncbi:aldehyde dehydrogenase family protein [Marinobacter panjinensis]|uniref:Aldehyde dehydrogenase family protein n=1 Tax=Marinobacter panjinensis TaxID=2576384 RepID=A0A4U6R413_9GAMM|nr:aldehyde dehydrogenase family protein [Marinobacter panjinensis]MCR8916341.1 aldehyde dehydrogenase family protein [Marinobacter panjinensis]TKV68201.1 aldehyde dehydrogenase family protein [Marinobacter panjinensis]